MTRRTKTAHEGLINLAGLALVLPSAAWYGFTLSVLWRWFVTPLGVAHIGVWEGAGLFLVVRFLTQNYDQPDDDRSAAEKLGRGIGIAVLIPATALAFGALYHALGR